MAHGVVPALTGDETLGIGRGFTAQLWDGFDPQAMDRDPGVGWYEEDNFMRPPYIPINTAVTEPTGGGGYTFLTENNAGAIVSGASAQGGVVQLANAASSGDNDETYMQGSRSYVLATADEDDTFPYHHVARVRFEARFCLNVVTNDVNMIFIGLSGQALAASLQDDDTGALVSTFHGIGCQILAADGNAINVVYQENGSTLQTPISGALVPVAQQWNRFGFDFNPLASDSERITYWLDGVKSSTFTTGANVAATTFPKSTDSVQIPMGATFLHKAGSDAIGILYISGYRVWSEPLVSRGNEACG